MHTDELNPYSLYNDVLDEKVWIALHRSIYQKQNRVNLFNRQIDIFYNYRAHLNKLTLSLRDCITSELER